MIPTLEDGALPGSAVRLATLARPLSVLTAQVARLLPQESMLDTLTADEAERTAFLANLCYAASIPRGRVAVVVAMRADSTVS